jgi:hypothetical protein
MVNNYENTIPDINAGRLTAMRWCYAAINLLLCCVNDTVCIFLVLIHAVILVAWFLNRDTSFFVAEKRKLQKNIAVKSSQLAYQKELEQNQPCWFDQFLIEPIEETPCVIESEKPKLSARQEQSWKDGFNDESNTIELDVSLPPSLSQLSEPRKKKKIEFEVL